MRVTGTWIGVVAALVTVAGIGCSDKKGCTLTEPLCDVETVTMEPAAVTLTAIGATSQLTLVARDADGAVLNVTDIPVTWSTGTASVATVSGTGLVTAVGAGTSVITATSELFPGETRTATVTVDLSAVATQLGVSTQPGGAASGAALSPQPVVQVRNSTGALVSSTAAVTASIASGGGTLGGTTTVNAVGGVATFTNLTVTGTAGARTLQFSSPGLTSATSASFDVTAPPPGGVAPWFLEDFSSYTNTADLLTTGGGRPFTSFHAESEGSYALDTVGVNINGLALTKSLRVNFPNTSTWTDDSRVVNGTPDRCDNYTMRPVITPNGTQFRSQRHLFLEFYVKFSSNFYTLPPSSWNCSGQNDHKTLLILPAGGSGRWEVKVGNGTFPDQRSAIKVGDPQFGQSQLTNVKRADVTPPDPETVAENIWDNEWHRLRIEISIGSSAGASDGVFRVWLDSTLIHQRTGMTLPAGMTGLDHIQLGANFNHGPREAMHFNWGLIRIYNSNPGW